MVRQINSYDYLRILATFAVVLLHTTAPLLIEYNTISTSEWMTGNIYDSLLRWCVPIFFMLSGAFMLDPNKLESLNDFFYKRILKLLIPLISWSLIYYCVMFYKNGSLTLDDFVMNLINNEVFYHLWFLYILIGLYLLTPILRILLKHLPRNLYEYLLILWFIGNPIFKLINHFFELKMYFEIPIDGYLGYFLLGYYLKNFHFKKRTNYIIYILAFISLIITIWGTYVGTVNNAGVFYEFYYSYLSPNTAIISIAIFIAFKNSKMKFAPKLVSKISSMTFGIFLVHALVLYLLTIKMSFFVQSWNPIARLPILAIITFLISLIICLILSKIPFVRKIVP